MEDALKKVTALRAQVKAIAESLDSLYVELAPKTKIELPPVLIEATELCCLKKLNSLGGKTSNGYFMQKQVECIKTYKDSSHLDYRLMKCKTCGKLYFYEFYEYVDFSGGNDQIYCTYVPVNSEEEADAMYKNIDRVSVSSYEHIREHSSGTVVNK